MIWQKPSVALQASSGRCTKSAGEAAPAKHRYINRNGVRFRPAGQELSHTHFRNGPWRKQLNQLPSYFGHGGAKQYIRFCKIRSLCQCDVMRLFFWYRARYERLWSDASTPNIITIWLPAGGSYPRAVLGLMVKTTYSHSLALVVTLWDGTTQTSIASRSRLSKRPG